MYILFAKFIIIIKLLCFSQHLKKSTNSGDKASQLIESDGEGEDSDTLEEFPELADILGDQEGGKYGDDTRRDNMKDATVESDDESDNDDSDEDGELCTNV